MLSAGLVKLQDLIRAPSDVDIEIVIRQGSPQTFRRVLKEVKSREIFNLIVDTKAESMAAFLRAVGFAIALMTDDKHHDKTLYVWVTVGMSNLGTGYLERKQKIC